MAGLEVVGPILPSTQTTNDLNQMSANPLDAKLMHCVEGSSKANAHDRCPSCQTFGVLARGETVAVAGVSTIQIVDALLQALHGVVVADKGRVPNSRTYCLKTAVAYRHLAHGPNNLVVVGLQH